MTSQEIYYSKLYDLQDRALNYIQRANTDFYLTGGTALSRFYLNHRYSDDLDLFVNHHPKFEQEVEKVKKELASAFGDELKIQINQDYFKRMFVHSGNISLNIELINDVPYHIGDFWSNDQFNRIDNWQNILSNKVSALNRNEERDIIDILFLAYRFQFQWRDIVDQAKEKDTWVEEIHVAQYFADIQVINSIRWIDTEWGEKINLGDLKQLGKDILLGEENTLFNPSVII